MGREGFVRLKTGRAGERGGEGGERRVGWFGAYLVRGKEEKFAAPSLMFSIILFLMVEASQFLGIGIVPPCVQSLFSSWLPQLFKQFLNLFTLVSCERGTHTS